jgi:hypothetical protein
VGNKILFGGGGLAWCEFGSLSTRRAVSGLIVAIDIELTGSPELGDAEVVLFGSVTAKLPDPTGWYEVGLAHAARPVFLPDAKEAYRQRSTTIEFALDSMQLAALEDLRAGRDFEFQLSLIGTAGRGEAPGATGTTNIHCPITSETWAHALSSGQSHRHFVVLAPQHTDGQNSRLHRVDGFIATAQEAMRDGRHNDAVFAVRKGIEALRIRQLSGPSTPRDRTVDQRFAALAEAMFSLASASGHPEEPNEDYVWTREDALAAIAVLVTLVRRESFAPIVNNATSST